MTERKNARSAAATAEQAGVGICYDILSSRLQSTTPPFVRQVSQFLLHGAENATPARELAKRAGYRSTRALRLAIERERRAGVLILANDDGYFLPSEDKAQALIEIKGFARRSDARMQSNRASVRACKLYIKAASRAEIDGQEVLSLE